MQVSAEVLSSVGPMSADAISIILKELVRRAISEVRRQQRTVFEVESKMGYDGNMDDVKTSADISAQRIIVKSIMECFPNCGILGEEGDDNPIVILPKNGCEVIITADPIDGTKAFVRGQSHGVGSMVAMVLNGKVISAWVGDINTQEIYGFRPNSSKTHRISEYNVSRYLGPQTKKISDCYMLLRDPLDTFTPAVYNMTRRCKNHLVDGGSIGIWAARLWKHEVGMAVVGPGYETPWDSAPVIGISEHLGYAFLRPKSSDQWVRFNPVIPKQPVMRDHEMLIIHESMLDQVPLYTKA